MGRSLSPSSTDATVHQWHGSLRHREDRKERSGRSWELDTDSGPTSSAGTAYEIKHDGTTSEESTGAEQFCIGYHCLILGGAPASNVERIKGDGVGSGYGIVNNRAAILGDPRHTVLKRKCPCARICI